jgi:hypothetical protein
LEYKVGADAYGAAGIDQVLDYAIDLKNFHSASHHRPIVPVLVATEAPTVVAEVVWYPDRVAEPLCANSRSLGAILGSFSEESVESVDPIDWCAGSYKPTPTIVEAARALYQGHNVQEISRSDAGAINLSLTSEAIGEAIEKAKRDQRKVICFVTGVPGSGKTLAGLNLATERMRVDEEEHAVFLSGNGPLVEVLREGLARDEVSQAKAEGRRLTKKDALTKVRAFIQNIHHFRDDNLEDLSPPVEKVVVFDEAQRAWNEEQTARFMREKRQQPGFEMSEPEFLLSVMDRHQDWCVVVCLVGGGQEINTGEAGLSSWFGALEDSFTDWLVCYSDRIDGPEYMNGSGALVRLQGVESSVRSDLHLGVSVRSFRAENVSKFVGEIIESNCESARDIFADLANYPIVLTRDLDAARTWLRRMARGTERYGLVASSNALRLRPEGLHVKSKTQPPNWFLNDKRDVRSSFAMEEVATEFDIQGLELDWVGMCWDANFRWGEDGWEYYTFSGTTWKNMYDETRRRYLANAYRVLLTRARQGMVIFLPEGDPDDPTRPPAYYDGTVEFLLRCGVPKLDE